MKFLVVLVLAVCTAGGSANLVWHSQPKQQVDMVKDAFWEYVAKATVTAEDTLMQIRESQLGKEVNSLIADSTDTITKLTNTLRTQVAPLTQDLMVKLSQEAERLKVRLEKDLTTVGTRVQPYAENMVADVQRQLEELKRDMALYADAMDVETLMAVLMQRSQELKALLDVEELKVQMSPYTGDIKGRMDQSLEEFQRTVVPLARSFETQMIQKTQEVQQSLAPYGEELRAKLETDTENLKRQLRAMWKSFMKLTQ